MRNGQGVESVGHHVCSIARPKARQDGSRCSRRATAAAQGALKIPCSPYVPVTKRVKNQKYFTADRFRRKVRCFRVPVVRRERGLKSSRLTA